MRAVALLLSIVSACAPVNPPVAPSVGSSLPSDHITVWTSDELIAALAQARTRDIVLMAGRYDAARPFRDDGGHRLYSLAPGAAVLNAGLVIGGSASARNAIVEGLSFDVQDREKTLDGAVIHVWGDATGARIVNVTIEGHGAVGAGLMVRQPDGLVVQHVVARGFTDYGIFVDASDGSRVVATPALLEDVTVSDVARQRPRSSNGTAEACLWLGNTGHVERARLRNCAWMGLWTGTASAGSTIEDLDVDQTPVGLYLEHFTTRSTFQRMRIGPKVDIGVNCEWADPAWGSKPACVDNLIKDSTIDSCLVGVALGIGTTRTTVEGISFRHQRIAGVLDAGGIGNVSRENDYTAMAVGSLAVTTDVGALNGWDGNARCSASNAQ